MGNIQARAPAEGIEPSPALAAQWETFLCTQDAQYARLAALQATPYVHLGAVEIVTVARLVAGFGIPPPHATAALRSLADVVALAGLDLGAVS